MKLYEETIKFNTYEILNSFIDLSKKRRELIGKDNTSNEIYSCLVGFSLGRRAGHTTAIMDYLENSHDGRDTIVIVPNTVMKEIYNKESYYSVNICENSFGMRGQDFSPKVFIFDSVNNIEISRFFLNTLVYYPDKIKALVAVN